MKMLKKGLLIAAVLPILSLANVYGSNTYSGSYAVNEPTPNQGGVVYPSYGVPGGGGYLIPSEVDPGQDEADSIYKANQHPGE